MNEQHLGSSLDDFRVEDGQLAEAEAIARHADCQCCATR